MYAAQFLSGRVALVTGGAGGIGAAVAEALHRSMFAKTAQARLSEVFSVLIGVADIRAEIGVVAVALAVGRVEMAVLVLRVHRDFGISDIR